jgi:hypothetical protein
MANRLPSSRLIFRTTSTNSGISCPQGPTMIKSCWKHRGDKFPRSVQEPVLGRNQAIPQTRPGVTTSPRFRHRRYAFDTSSAFAHARLSEPYLTGSCPAFSATLTTPALDRRSLRHVDDANLPAHSGGLEPAPDGRLRRTYLHLLHSTAPSFVGAFVAHCRFGRRQWEYPRAASLLAHLL